MYLCSQANLYLANGPLIEHPSTHFFAVAFGLNVASLKFCKWFLLSVGLTFDFNLNYSSDVQSFWVPFSCRWICSDFADFDVSFKNISITLWCYYYIDTTHTGIFGFDGILFRWGCGDVWKIKQQLQLSGVLLSKLQVCRVAAAGGADIFKDYYTKSGNFVPLRQILVHFKCLKKPSSNPHPW